MIHQSHLNTAVAIIGAYEGKEPFHFFSKHYFSQHKKYGSRDRKKITTLCYQYFRLGYAGVSLNTADKILAAHFLCETEPSALLAHFRPLWNEQIGTTLDEKLLLLKEWVYLPDVFPFCDDLSAAIVAEAFVRSFFRQPRLYLRVRPGAMEAVREKLNLAGIAFATPEPDTIALPNTTKTDTLFSPDVQVVVQDISSQRVGRFILQALAGLQGVTVRAWDCCAASGGKSILLYDLAGGAVDLTVADIRPSILHNLQDRFARAGIHGYQMLIADLSVPESELLRQKIQTPFNLIICDVPCSGSGTWSRTPEQLPGYNRDETAHYAALQQKIVTSAARFLAEGGYFLYITCSVFAQENEAMAYFIRDRLGLALQAMQVFEGYKEQGDTMFAALFRYERKTEAVRQK